MAKDVHDRICWRTGCRSRATHQAKSGAFHCDEHKVFDWTDEWVKTLRALHAEGLSGREIALRLGHGLTRNAVLGKLNRIGLTTSAKPGRPKNPRSEQSYINNPRRARRLHVVTRVKPSQVETRKRVGAGRSDGSALALLMAQSAGRVVPMLKKDGTARELHDGSKVDGAKTIQHRQPFECAWPLDPVNKSADADTLFCCRPIDGDFSYCARHRRMAFQPQKQSAKEFERGLRRFL